MRVVSILVLCYTSSTLAYLLYNTAILYVSTLKQSLVSKKFYYSDLATNI